MPRPTNEPIAQILLLGDSLTQLAFEGWGSTLANIYQRRADVINRGGSGYTTTFYQRLLQRDGLPTLSNVCLVTIFFGANDASLPAENPHHYVSVSDYSRHLRAMIGRVQDKYGPTVRILLITPPPLDHAKRLLYQKERYGDKATGILERTTEHTSLYADACRDVGLATQTPCLDLFTLMHTEPNYGRFLNDGLHFTKEGHDFVAHAVVQAIRTHYTDLHVTPCPVTGQYNNSASICPALTSWGPYHDAIDHTNVDAAF